MSAVSASPASPSAPWTWCAVPPLTRETRPSASEYSVVSPTRSTSGLNSAKSSTVRASAPSKSTSPSARRLYGPVTPADANVHTTWAANCFRAFSSSPPKPVKVYAPSSIPAYAIASFSPVRCAGDDSSTAGASRSDGPPVKSVIRALGSDSRRETTQRRSVISSLPAGSKK